MQIRKRLQTHRRHVRFHGSRNRAGMRRRMDFARRFAWASRQRATGLAPRRHKRAVMLSETKHPWQSLWAQSQIDPRFFASLRMTLEQDVYSPNFFSISFTRAKSFPSERIHAICCLISSIGPAGYPNHTQPETFF